MFNKLMKKVSEDIKSRPIVSEEKLHKLMESMKEYEEVKKDERDK